MAIVVLACLSIASTPFASGPAAEPGAACSKAKAKRLINKNEWNDFLLKDPVADLVCGSFAGTGSRAMAVTVAAGTCGNQQWGVFARRARGWKAVFHRREFVVDLEAVGESIRVTSPVHAPSDAGRCVFTGGTRSHDWTWKNGGLKHGRWEYQPTDFLSPDKQVWCLMQGDDRGTFCGTADSRHMGWVDHGGKTTLCNTVEPGCNPNFDRAARVLRQGVTSSHYGFSCVSEATAVTCVDDESGKGFRVSKDAAVAVG